MSSAAIWRSEGISPVNSPKASVLLRESTIDNRLNALREVALTLLDAVDALRGARPSGDHRLKLHDEVRQFETELIRTALERTGGNQARAARLLGVKHTTLNAKIKRYRIACDAGSSEVEQVVGNREIAA
jgi:transcriptional regulator with GAF, ATPase, and Fis domain